MRDLQRLVPGLSLIKLNTILKYLISKGDLLLDSDSYIIWIRGKESDELTLGDVAEISQDIKRLLDSE